MCYNLFVALDQKSSERVRLDATVRGLVQGVNFRWFAQRRANALGLGGFVRNLPDGSVQVVAEGDRETIELLLQSLREGPSHASVESVDTAWGTPNGEFHRFEIRY